jgi:exodeoxyribonuclease V beta subunit
LRAPSAVVAAAAAAELPDYVDAPAGPPIETAPPRGIFAFAKGARAGTCLHEIFEKCDFTRVREAETAALVETTLRRHGLDAPTAHPATIAPTEVVTRMLEDVLESTLPGTRFSLSAVSRAQKLPEWQFHLPMGAVSQNRLAEIFAKHGVGAIRERYPAELRALGDRTVEGFLMGFVDLVFVHDGRWYLVDWKSNHLGNTANSYDAESIGRAMREHHYVLQYHLYTVALHRYLGQRLRGYDYDEHFGGIYYAFLRGIRADAPGGWYFDRPPRALVDALDTLMQRRAAA